MQDRAHHPPPDAEWRALLAGVLAAPVLLVLGVVVGLVEGGLLPWACEGLACLFNSLVLGATAIIAVTWLVLWVVVRLARRRWPRSTLRLWILRLVAVVSWVPVVWLLVVAVDG